MPPVLYDDPDILYDDPNVLYEQPVPESPQGIEAWVTTAAGVYIAHLDRSEESPFRDFWFGLLRNEAGVGRLEYHLDNELVREHPTLFAKGNLVHMQYRAREFVWAVRENGSGLGSDEAAGDWVKVSGPGVWPRRRLVFPPDFASGANLNPKTWATQWRSFVNRAAGELLWDVLSESNARFATQFVRGTVETTGADGITTDYRFEDIGDDVIPSVLAARGGEVRFDGLTFNYYNPGHGADLSGSVIFEEGADLLSLKYTNTNRDGLTWIVGEGVGEGVYSKLAVSEIAASERMEGFYAAKDAGNVPLLELMTDAALDEHDDDLEALAIEVSESRLKAFTDFDLSDTIRVVAPSRGIDHTAQIVAMYVAEDDDRVRIAFDLGVPRIAPDISTAEAVKAALSRIGVRDKQPQGQYVPAFANGTGVMDENNPMGLLLDLLEEFYLTHKVKVSLAFKPYFAPATAASSGGGSTSGASSAASSASGGSSTPTSGASSASSSASGGSSTPTSGASSASTTVNDSGATHFHVFATFSSDTPGSFTKRKYTDGVVNPFNLETDATSENRLTDTSPITHNHDMPHTHDVSIGSHTHNIEHTHVVTIEAHDHTIAHDHTTPNHTHGLTYGVVEEAYPASHNVSLAISKRVGSNWNLITTVSGLTDDVEQFYVEQYIDGPGLWRLELQSIGGQPQGGRLGCDMSVSVLGAIKSA